jgi:hypothetical protein
MGRSLRACSALTPGGVALRGVFATLLLIVFVAAPSRAFGAESHEATTSPAARREAIAAIPLKRIAPAFRPRVETVLNDASLFRRMPTSVIDCRPEMFTYFSENPETLVAIWRRMGLSKVRLERTGPDAFDLSDGAGTTGTLTIVDSQCDKDAQNRVVLYVQGQYEGKPFNRRLTASCVLLLRSGSVVETNDRTYVASRLDCFVKLDQPTVEILAKAAHPFVGKTADRNFSDTLAFVSNLSYTAERRPEAVERLATDLEGVEPARCDRLIEVARHCGDEGRRWEVSQVVEPVVNISPR